MSMELNWEGPSIMDFLDEFEESTAKSRRDSKVVLRQGAKAIMKASQEMCPVDEHNLEQAHHIEDIRLNQDEVILEISVGGEVNGREVDEYAWLQHEFLQPFGAGGGWDKHGSGPHLGPKSVIKNENNPSDRPVGGKFLERAVDLYRDELVEKIAQTLPGQK